MHGIDRHKVVLNKNIPFSLSNVNFKEFSEIKGYWPQSMTNFYMTSSTETSSAPHLSTLQANSYQGLEPSYAYNINKSNDFNQATKLNERCPDVEESLQNQRKTDNSSPIVSNDLQEEVDQQEVRIPEFTNCSAARNSANNPKLSYTPFQLELLNTIYSKWKHPKAEQKTFIAKCVGITRKQAMVSNKYKKNLNLTRI